MLTMTDKQIKEAQIHAGKIATFGAQNTRALKALEWFDTNVAVEDQSHISLDPFVVNPDLFKQVNLRDFEQEAAIDYVRRAYEALLPKIIELAIDMAEKCVRDNYAECVNLITGSTLHPKEENTVSDGMTPYGPGHPDYPNAPNDWDGGPVKLRDGSECYEDIDWNWNGDFVPVHYEVVAYRKRA